MLAEYVSWILGNFDMSMFILAIVFIIFHRIMIRKGISNAEIVYRWLMLFELGFTGVYAFIMHAFFPDLTSSSMGWPMSPFQMEVAMANLGFAAIAILSFNASYGFRLAAVIANTFWLWGGSLGHMYQMMQYQHYSLVDVGSWFWMDMLTPVILIICIIQKTHCA